MKFSVLFLLVAFLFMPGQSASVGPSGCPPNEYSPGPNCGTEPTCAPPSSHFWPKHTCDCWCLPGRYRDIDTNQCVKNCSMHPSMNEIVDPL